MKDKSKLCITKILAAISFTVVGFSNLVFANYNYEVCDPRSPVEKSIDTPRVEAAINSWHKHNPSLKGKDSFVGDTIVALESEPGRRFIRICDETGKLSSVAIISDKGGKIELEYLISRGTAHDDKLNAFPGGAGKAAVRAIADMVIRQSKKNIWFVALGDAQGFYRHLGFRDNEIQGNFSLANNDSLARMKARHEGIWAFDYEIPPPPPALEKVVFPGPSLCSLEVSSSPVITSLALSSSMIVQKLGSPAILGVDVDDLPPPPPPEEEAPILAPPSLSKVSLVKEQESEEIPPPPPPPSSPRKSSIKKKKMPSSSKSSQLPE